jgi:hypothetical protein
VQSRHYPSEIWRIQRSIVFLLPSYPNTNITATFGLASLCPGWAFLVYGIRWRLISSIHDFFLPSHYLMAFVLPSPSNPQFDLPFGSPICSRSCSLSDVGTVRHLVVRNSSHVSFASIASSPLLSSRKENHSPLSASTGSLTNFKLYDGIPLSTSPRRSYSWNVPREPPAGEGRSMTMEMNGKRNQSEQTSLRLVAVRLDNPPRPTEGDESGPPEAPREEYEDDRPFSTTLGTSNPASSTDSVDEFLGFDGVEYVDFQEESHDVTSEDDRRSPFRRWLRVLRRRHAPQPEMIKPSEERWTLDDFDPTPLLTPTRSNRPELRHRKTLSSVSSGVLLSAVRSASVTLASMSLYPRSRRSALNSAVRSDVSDHDMVYGRSSFESTGPSLPLIDDGTWFRSVQRNRTVEEIISSEESYIRDLKTLINVVIIQLFHIWVLKCNAGISHSSSAKQQ